MDVTNRTEEFNRIKDELADEVAESVLEDLGQIIGKYILYEFILVVVLAIIIYFWDKSADSIVKSVLGRDMTPLETLTLAAVMSFIFIILIVNVFKIPLPSK